MNCNVQKVAVIGLGYVGLPLLRRLQDVGHQTIGVDIDKRKLELLADGDSYIDGVDAKLISEQVKLNNCQLTDDFGSVANADSIILCLPTPLDKYQQPDLSFILTTIEQIGPWLNRGQLVSLESTTYPGTTHEVLRRKLEGFGFTVGEDLYLVYSPERIDPGNREFATHSIPKLVSGETTLCLQRGLDLYSAITPSVIPVSTTQTAEMAKILENTFRAVNIALINEMKVLADRMGVDIYEVVDAAATKPFGYMPFYPGPGLGGHCIPIDPFYLTWKAKEYGLHTQFIELAGKVNSAMPEYVIDKIAKSLNTMKLSINGSKILVLGVAYKKNIGDLRESPSLLIIETLLASGADVSYSDPFVEVLPKMRKYDLNLRSVSITTELVQSKDLVVVATDHDDFDWSVIEKNARMIVDCRGRFRDLNKSIVRA